MQPDFLSKTPAKNYHPQLSERDDGSRFYSTFFPKKVTKLTRVFVSALMFDTWSSSVPMTDEGNCVFSKHKNGTARMVETMSSWHNAGRSIAKRSKRSPNVRLTCFIIAGETFDCLAEDLNPFSAGTVFIRQNLTSVDVRFWRINTIPTLVRAYYSKRCILKVCKAFLSRICLAVVFTQFGYADSKSAPCQALFSVFPYQNCKTKWPPK